MEYYEIIDNDGVIHSGSEDEMLHAFDVMKNSEYYEDEDKDEYDTWYCEWNGDLKLIKVIDLI